MDIKVETILKLVIIIAVIALAFYIGGTIVSVVTGLFAFLGFSKSPEEKKKEAKENIKKAGDQVDEAKKHTADSARDKLNNIIDKQSGDGSN